MYTAMVPEQVKTKKIKTRRQRRRLQHWKRLGCHFILLYLYLIGTLKAKRTTKISQSSGPIHLVLDETIYKEWEDRMERAATTASSLEAEQDSGDINMTQSMVTLNESFPKGTNSGSRLRIGIDTARHKLNTASIKLVLPRIS
ncbi:hypothetical protein Tco_0945617 [Tanacetum coccineum]